MFGWGKKKQQPQPTENNGCAHEKATAPFEITVHGCKFTVEPPAPHCPACAEKYLNATSTLCGSCGEPIVPGTPVAPNTVSHNTTRHLTHLTGSCCPSGGLFCGLWGAGRLISLHELDPHKYGPGTATVAEHALRTGQMVIEHPDRFLR